jgi:hypothetical protein
MGFFYEFSLKKGLFLLKMGFFDQKKAPMIRGFLRYFKAELGYKKGPSTNNAPRLLVGHCKNHKSDFSSPYIY